MYGIKLFCFALRQLFHFCRNNAQAVFFKAAVNLADDVFFYRIGFDDGNRTFDGNIMSLFLLKGKLS